MQSLVCSTAFAALASLRASPVCVSSLHELCALRSTCAVGAATAASPEGASFASAKRFAPQLRGGRASTLVQRHWTARLSCASAFPSRRGQRDLITWGETGASALITSWKGHQSKCRPASCMGATWQETEHALPQQRVACRAFSTRSISGRLFYKRRPLQVPRLKPPNYRRQAMAVSLLAPARSVSAFLDSCLCSCCVACAASGLRERPTKRGFVSRRVSFLRPCCRRRCRETKLSPPITVSILCGVCSSLAAGARPDPAEAQQRTSKSGAREAFHGPHCLGLHSRRRPLAERALLGVGKRRQVPGRSWLVRETVFFPPIQSPCREVCMFSVWVCTFFVRVCMFFVRVCLFLQQLQSRPRSVRPLARAQPQTEAKQVRGEVVRRRQRIQTTTLESPLSVHFFGPRALQPLPLGDLERQRRGAASPQAQRQGVPDAAHSLVQPVVPTENATLGTSSALKDDARVRATWKRHFSREKEIPQQSQSAAAHWTPHPENLFRDLVRYLGVRRGGGVESAWGS